MNNKDRLRLRGVIACVALCGFGLVRSEGLGDDSELRQRFLNEYPAAVERIEKAYGSIQLKARCEVPQPDGVDPLVEQHAYYGNGENLRLDMLESGGGERAQVATPTRNFRLVKNEATSDFVVEELDVSTYKAARESIRLFAKLPYAAFCIFEFPFITFMRDPAFSLISAEEIEHAGRQMVKITWELPDFVPDVPKGEYVAGGWVILSPDESWVIYESFYNYRINIYPDAGIHVVIEYGEELDGVPIPTTMTRSSVTSEGRRIAERQETVELITEPASSEEFQLSAFGIPNNVGRGGAQVSRYRQLVILLNVALVCGLLVFFLIRRRSKTDPAATKG